MKEVAMDGVAPFLPQEIITNILTFLPVKSLIRFQCVCKHWKKLIKAPFFIDAHLHHSTQRIPGLLLCPYLIDSQLRLYSLDCELQIVEVQNKPVVNGSVLIGGSSNGLLCLIDMCRDRKSPPYSLSLWNPALREVRQLPTSFPDRDSACYVGFGFCPIVNDYKIVRLYVSVYDHLVHIVEVYSLGIGSWKKIEIGNLKGLILMNDAGFTVNGSIFWFGFKQDTGEDREYVMVSFDIAMEVFELIPVPAINLRYGVRVTEFEHRLAMLSSTLIGNSESCLIELWVLEEGGTGGSGERWSWAKKYTSSSRSCLCPITIWRNEIACICRVLPGDGRFELLERTFMSTLSDTELKNGFLDYGHFIFNYVESLVPVSNIHVEES